jgi:hypothetical protein
VNLFAVERSFADVVNALWVEADAPQFEVEFLGGFARSRLGLNPDICRRRWNLLLLLRG